MSNFITVASVEELPAGERIVAEIDDLYVAVFNVDGTLYAIEDVCTHDDGPLVEGQLLEGDAENPKIECARHGATFELKTGKPTFPAVTKVKRFPVRIEGDEVQINVEETLN